MPNNSNLIFPGSAEIPSWYIIDKIYSNGYEATVQCADDGIMIGRYILVKYCDTEFKADIKASLEEITPVEIPETDEQKYTYNYNIDKNNNFKYSQDRMLYQKNAVKQRDGSYNLEYKQICYLGQADWLEVKNTLMGTFSESEQTILGNRAMLTRLLGEDIITENISIRNIAKDQDKKLTLSYENGNILLSFGENSLTEEEQNANIITKLDATPFIKDSFLKEVSLNDDTNTLKFVWKISDENDEITEEETDLTLNTLLTDLYSAGNKAIQIYHNVNDNKNKIDLVISPDDLLEITENGLSSNQIKSELIYNSNTPLLKDLGGLKAGETFENISIKTLLDKMLYPYVPPSIKNFSIEEAKGNKPEVYEKGTSINISKLTVEIQKGSEELQSLEFFINGTDYIQTVTCENGKTEYDYTPDSGWNITGEEDAAGQVVIQTAIIDEESKRITKNLTYSFVYPYFVGVTSNINNLSQTFNQGSNKLIEKKWNNKKQKYITSEEQCPFVAYPNVTGQEYGKLKIQDPNGYSQEWKETEATYEGLGGEKVPYIIRYGEFGAATATYIFNHEGG